MLKPRGHRTYARSRSSECIFLRRKRFTATMRVIRTRVAVMEPCRCIHKGTDSMHAARFGVWREVACTTAPQTTGRQWPPRRSLQSACGRAQVLHILRSMTALVTGSQSHQPRRSAQTPTAIVPWCHQVGCVAHRRNTARKVATQMSQCLLAPAQTVCATAFVPWTNCVTRHGSEAGGGRPRECRP